MLARHGERLGGWWDLTGWARIHGAQDDQELFLDKGEAALHGGDEVFCAHSLFLAGAAMLHHVQVRDNSGRVDSAAASSGDLASAVTAPKIIFTPQ